MVNSDSLQEKLAPIELRISALNRWQKTLFCICLLQRSSPNFQLFAENTDPEHAEALSKLLNLFWESQLVPSSRINFAVQHERFELVIPNPDDYDFFGVYPALDCCVLAELCFSCIGDFQGDEASNALQTSLASVLSFLELQNPEFDEHDAQHLNAPLLVDELEFANSLLLMLANHDKGSKQAAELRTLAYNQGVSNIGICLEDD
ncbi:DUF416 family protein [Alginatibacterium sediminis]|uniref:DUF416 family protein n=1 Tax=Alginatibacterium sediminis TaxID=2164068 RepID=A0A420E7I0_9ALTE|nr:YjaG family protein [Alginatibacterium sediminis]RKF14444.1 DUF416 family protein [Alginatibacterium sediminis]